MKPSQSSNTLTILIYFLGVAGIAFFMSIALAPKHEQRSEQPQAIEQPQEEIKPTPQQTPAISIVNKNKTRRVKAQRPKRVSRNLYDAGGSIGFQ